MNWAVAVLVLMCVGSIRGDDSSSPFTIGLVRDKMQSYASQDLMIWQGLQWWVDWIQGQGGLKYGNITRQVNVTAHDTSTLDSNAIPQLLTDAYTQMCAVEGIDLAIAPYNTARTIPAINVTVKYNKLLFGTSGTISLFKNGSNYFSGIAPSNVATKWIAEAVTKLPGVQSYSIFASTDTISLASIPTSTGVMNAAGMKLTCDYRYAITTTDPTQVTEQIASNLQNFTQICDIGDVLAVYATGDWFATIALQLAQARPNLKLAVFFVPTDTLTEQQLAAIDPSGWLINAPFYNETNYGTSGVLGGTTSEFYWDFYNKIGIRPPYAAVITAANLVAYTVAVQRAGTVNSSAVQAELVNMPPLNLFYGTLKFVSNGTDVTVKYNMLQYIKGKPTIVLDAPHIQYPAPFPWLQPETVPTYRNINTSISALGAVVGAALLVACFAAVMLALRWEDFRSHGPFFCALIIVGVYFAYGSVIALLPSPSTASCTAFPWLLGVGFTLVYGCLFVKTWALHKIHRSAEKLKRLHLTPFYIMRLIGLYLSIEIIILIVWTAVDKPTSHYQKTVDGNYQLQCTSHPTFWIIFAVTKAIWLIFGAVLSVLTRDMAKEYSESKSIAFAIYNIIALLVIGVPLTIALETIPGGAILVQGGVIVIAFTFTMCNLFAGIWMKILFSRHEPTLSMMALGTNSTRTSSGSPPSSPTSSSASKSSGVVRV